MTYNQDPLQMPDEEARSQVPYNDALYQRAQVKYFMDFQSLASFPFTDFRSIGRQRAIRKKVIAFFGRGQFVSEVENQIRDANIFDKAKQFALTDDDKKEADENEKKTYCGQDEQQLRTTWGFLLCWLKNIYSSTYRYRLYHGATFLRNDQLKFIQHQQFYLSLVTGLNGHRISAQQKALTVSCNLMRPLYNNLRISTSLQDVSFYLKDIT